METEAIIIEKSKIELEEQILFDRPNSLVVCRIVDVREKSVKVDYELMPCSPGSSSNAPTVYSYTCYVPISVITHDKYGSLTVKKWFANKWKGGVRIKPYFMKDGKKVNV